MCRVLTGADSRPQQTLLLHRYQLPQERTRAEGIRLQYFTSVVIVLVGWSPDKYFK